MKMVQHLTIPWTTMHLLVGHTIAHITKRKNKGLSIAGEALKTSKV